MSFVKVEGNNTFEWKVNINQKTAKLVWSDTFSVDEREFNVLYDPEYLNCQRLRQFRLYYHYVTKVFPISYICSILDSEGHVFVTSKGKVLFDSTIEARSLMIIDASYLNVWNLVKSGQFTVRFSFNLILDTQEGSYPTKAEASNVADSATNTNPPVTKDSSTNTDVSATFLEDLSNDFSTLYESKTDTDCVLKVSDAQFRAHRSVLAARSSVFSAMFHHDTAESSSGEVNIQDVKATTLSDVLSYVYSGKIRGLTDDTAAPMYIAADKYDLIKLRKECLVFLKRNLTMNNFCEAALLSYMHGEVELEERVLRFIEDNLDDILESNAWKQFSKDKTSLALKLFTSAFKNAKKK